MVYCPLGFKVSSQLEGEQLSAMNMWLGGVVKDWLKQKIEGEDKSKDETAQRTGESLLVCSSHWCRWHIHTSFPD